MEHKRENPAKKIIFNKKMSIWFFFSLLLNLLYSSFRFPIKQKKKKEYKDKQEKYTHKTPKGVYRHPQRQ